MPPIIAILLALFTKEVYLSLFAGCAGGAAGGRVSPLGRV